MAGRLAQIAPIGGRANGATNAITVNVVVIGYYVAEVDANTKRDPRTVGFMLAGLRDASLDFDGAGDSVDNAGEFDEQPVANALYDPAVELLDRRLKPFAANGLRQTGQMIDHSTSVSS